MASQLQLRRGTTVQHGPFIGAPAEVTVDTDKKTVVVHDGSTAGGFPSATAAELTAGLATKVSIGAAAGGALSGTYPNPTLAAVTATGSTEPRSVQDRFADMVNVKDFGAVGNDVADDLAAIQAAVAAASGKTVFFPAGTYRMTQPLVIETATTLLGAGQGKTFLRGAHAGNVVTFQPSAAGISNVFLSSAGIADLHIIRTTANGTVGTNLWIRQCNGFVCRNVSVNNGNECIRVTGGQLNSIIGCRAFASDATIVRKTTSGCLYFEEATLSGGTYQPCYTINVTDFIGSASNILDSIIHVGSSDGLNVTNAYMAFAKDSIVTLRKSRNGTGIGTIALSNCYMDCVDPVGGGITGSPHALRVFHSFSNTWGAVSVSLSNCILANNDDAGTSNALIYVQNYVVGLNVTNCYIANGGSPWAVQINDTTAVGPQGEYSFTNNLFRNLSDASGGGAIYVKDALRTNITGNTFSIIASVGLAQILFDGTIGSACVVGNLTDGVAPDFVVFASGMTINGNAMVMNAGQTTNNVVSLSLPASSSGLPTGSLFNSAGTVRVVGSSITGSATYDPPNLVDGDGDTTTVTATGAALGDYAEASFSLDLQGITVAAWVSAANTVSVRFQNETGGTIDLASGTLRVRITKP